MSMAMTSSHFYLPGSFVVRGEKQLIPSVAATGKAGGGGGRRLRVSSFLFDPTGEQILKQAIKEPIAFMGGMFAGLLRLDLNEDPLKEWITRTVEASGIRDEEINDDDEKQPEEESPQEIQIE